MGGVAGRAVALVGRDAERASLEGLVVGRSPAVALVRGAAGMGKTRLVEEATAFAHRRGRALIAASALEMERDRPFGPFVDALRIHSDAVDEAAAHVSRLLREPGRSGLPAPEVRYAVVEHLVSIMENRAEDAGLLVIVEDLHYADPSTMLTLNRLVQRTPRTEVAVICTSRPAPQADALEAFSTSVSAVGGLVVDLAPLGADDVESLVRALMDDEPDAALMESVHAAGGNPLFVREIVTASRSSAEETPAPDADLPVLIPASVRSSVGGQVRSLGADVAEIMRTASVLGSAFLVDDLATLVARPTTDIVPMLTDALRAGILRDAGETLAFRHDLVRDALYHDMPASVRRGLHVHAARAFAAVGRPATQVAAHFAVGASSGDHEAVDWLRRAAAEASVTAPSIATDLAQRAFEIASDPAVQDEISADLVVYLSAVRRLKEAEDIARRLIDVPLPPALTRRTRLALLNNLFGQGRIAEQVDLAERFAADSEDERDRLRYLAESVLGLCVMGDLARAEARGRDILSEAEQLGEVATMDVVLTALTTTFWLSGRLTGALELAQRRLALVPRLREIGDELPLQGQTPPVVTLMVVLNDLDRVDEADAVRRAAIEELRRAGLPDPAKEFRGTSGLITGRWDEGLVEAEGALFVEHEGGVAKFVGSAAGVVAYISIHRDELDHAEWALDFADEYIATRGVSSGLELMFVRWSRSLWLEASGRNQEAFDLLRETWHSTRASAFVLYRILVPDVVRMAVAAGDIATATDATEALELAAQLEPDVRSIEGAALRARGLLDRDPSLLERAVAAYRSTPRLAEWAMTAEDAGRMLAEAGREQEAIAYLTEALELYESPLGAARLIARTDALLRSLGVKRGKVGRRKRPSTGWDALTDAENRVVDLSAEGLANAAIAERLFISKRTVEAHVSNIMRKLGVTSRAELIAQAARRSA